MSTTATADQILRYKVPEQLFSSLNQFRDEYKVLCKIWHPDLNRDPQAEAVIRQLNVLHDLAVEKETTGTWEPVGKISFIGTDKITRNLRYRTARPFELGMMYYGNTAIAYVVKTEFADLFKNGRERISKLKYENDKMKKEMSRFLPKVQTAFETTDNKHVLVLQKTDDVYCLRDLLDSVGQQIEPTHVAWMLNGIYNIACYLNWAELTHNGINVDTTFVSPKHHSVMLYGGWWYAQPFGYRLNAIPTFSDVFGPPDIIRDRRAQYKLDLTTIRAVGRVLLGDPNGVIAKGPDQMVKFLQQPSSGSAREDYDRWANKVLPACFGKRRFVEMVFSESDIYKE